MKYKLFRQNQISRSALDLNKPELQESQLIELISRMLKNIKKKQHIYNRILSQTLRKHQKALDQDNLMVLEFEKLILQVKELEHSFGKFKHQSFYASKNYLYTVFMRTSEILQMSKQKCLTESKIDAQSVFQVIKEELKQIYLDETYQQNYQIMQIFNFINKNQQVRINSLVRKNLSIHPLYFKKQRIILQKLKDYQLQGLKKTQSIGLLKRKDEVIDQIITRKLNFELATEKRMKQRQNLKLKKSLLKIYDVLEVKSLHLQLFNAQSQEAVMIQRNASIKQSMRKWQKRYLAYRFGKSYK